MVDKKVIKSLGIYCRVSSKKQMDNQSLDNQKERGIKYCKENDYDYKVFSDVISGSKVNRDGLSKLFEMIYDGGLDGIVLYEWDRLQRESRELLVEFEKLILDTNCVVIVDNRKRDIIDNISDRIEYEFKNTLSNIERMRLKKRVGEGIERMMERGNTLFGNLKFGYKNEGRKSTLHTVLDETNSIVVSEIFRVFNMVSVKKIDDCRKIINDKFNKNYQITFISNCLTYDGYKGETYQKWGKNPIKEYKITIPKIVSEELWDKTQLKFKKIQRNRIGRDREFHLLKGLIYCGNCDDRLYKYAKVPNGSNYNQSWYRCKWGLKPQYDNNRRLWENGKKCKGYKSNYISRGFLEIVVWDMLFKSLKESKHLKKKYEDKYKNDLRLKDSNKYSKTYYENKIKDVESKKFQLYDDFLSKKVKRKDYELYNRRYDNEIVGYDERIVEIKGKIESFHKMDKIDFNEIESLMNKDLELKFNIQNGKDKRRLIDKYIEKIYLKRIDNENYYINFEMKIGGIAKDIPFNKTYIKNRVLYHSDSYICLLRLDIKSIFRLIRVKKDKSTYLFKHQISNYNCDIV